MAVCNLFNELTSSSGNFLMFSQYVEDLTRNYSDGDNYKVVPSKFIAMNIDYSNLNLVSNESTNLDEYIPKYFQNYYENGCAYGRNNINGWSPTHAKNLFWNCMCDANYGLTKIPVTENNNSYTFNNIMCCCDINMHSYNTHQGMGYGEIYCYIPTDQKQEKYSITIKDTSIDSSENTEQNLEGFSDNDNYKIGSFPKTYSYNDNYSIALDETPEEINSSNYNINTIVVLYSIKEKLNDTWNDIEGCTDIPMGIYFAGKFNLTQETTSTTLSNTITKFTDTTYGTGTSYGLRICTRFSATSQGKIINADIIQDESNAQTNICQLMTAMSENLSRMTDIVKSSISETQGYKDLLSVIKNNRINVPYIKQINGQDYWFVNGKLISTVLTNTTE